ncbi:unnamed protein product [Brassicogethes aeneus]|uniref:Kinesin motor domain-containing protein n=1 Tax=Brassicogethes aeneus TaxID=1431903 RepID=A0A9P0BEW8_BRAAE|nr:unnamed protein product [Brassicogethes aeneus]
MSCQCLNGVKTNLSVSEPKDDEKLKVFLRIKANVDFNNLYSINDKTLTCTIPHGPSGSSNIKEGNRVSKKFEFSKIFGAGATQKDVFDDIVKPKLLRFIDGKNSTLMTYGASGAGKTYTIIGTASNPGLVPRTLEYLFGTIPQLSQAIKVKPNWNGSISTLNDSEMREEKHNRTEMLSFAQTSDNLVHLKTYAEMQRRLSIEPAAEVREQGVFFGMWVSFAEIYNEQIYDLLVPPPTRGRQRNRLKLGNDNGTAHIKNLTSIYVNSGMEAYQILQYGIKNLNHAATSLNPNSSRSHSIFTIKLSKSIGEGKAQVSHFNFCDLAGTERQKKTQNVGDRLKESKNINGSLLVLGKCIDSIRNSQSGAKAVVPYRESKLTQLFQRALSGKEDICMIVNVNPCREMFQETQQVLNFSAIAKNIIIDEQPAVKVLPKKPSRFSMYMSARSTSIQPKMETSDDEEESRDFRKDYEREYETVKLRECLLDMDAKWLEREELDRLDRLKISDMYDKIIHNIHAFYERFKEHDDAKHKEELERERAKWREHYKNKRAKYDDLEVTEIIDLVSEEEEESDEDEKSEQEEDQNREEDRARALAEENRLLIRKNRELTLILADAKEEYNNLQKECVGKQRENMDLRGEIYSLEEMVELQEAHIYSLNQQIMEEIVDDQDECNECVSKRINGY